MIFDAHTHLGYCWPEAYDMQFGVSEARETSHFHPEDLLKIMDSLGIDKATIQTTNEWALGGNLRENKEIAEIAAKHPQRFVGVANINPLLGEQAVQQLRTCVEDLRIKGLKLHPFKQCFRPYYPVVYPLVEQSIKLKIPIFIHSGNDSLSLPMQIGALADRFPDATIIMLHGGEDYKSAHDARWVAKKYDNIILDTSGALSPLFVKEAVSVLGAEKVVFGSDTPWSLTEEQLNKIKILRLPEKQESLILGENLEKIMRV